MLKIENFDKIIIANWKLNGSSTFTERYLDKIRFYHNENHNRCVIICPPLPFINKINLKNFFIGAQDCSVYDQGSYTGEVSAKMLKDIGCQLCIIGHSERRTFFNENNEIISKKLTKCLQSNIVPVLCIGENLQHKKAKLTKDVIREQIIKGVPNNTDNKKIIIAYEPIWAIGTGLTPSLNEISEIHMFIKNKVFQDKDIKILYGGSIKANNYKDILDLDEVDGLLVGSSSIDIDEFNKIIKF